MPATIAGSHLGPDTHANRPAANAAGQPIGALYSCTTHSLIYITNGSAWSTYATLGTTGTPAGTEMAYTAVTTAVTVSGTSEGTAQTIATAGSTTYEAVPYMVEIFSPRADQNGGTLICDIYVDSTLLGRIAVTSAAILPIQASIRYTPTAGAHTFTWKAWRATANPVIDGDVGGTAKSIAAYIRVTKV